MWTICRRFPAMSETPSFATFRKPSLLTLAVSDTRLNALRSDEENLDVSRRSGRFHDSISAFAETPSQHSAPPPRQASLAAAVDGSNWQDELTRTLDGAQEVTWGRGGGWCCRVWKVFGALFWSERLRISKFCHRMGSKKASRIGTLGAFCKSGTGWCTTMVAQKFSWEVTLRKAQVCQTDSN